MRRTRIVAIAICAMLVVVPMTGCCPLLASGDQQAAESGSMLSTVEPTLGEFLGADTKTGRYTRGTVWAEGDTLDQTGEFWIDGRQFRYDIYEQGTLVRSIVSPDGQTAYFVHHDKQTCEPSVASVDYYLMRYSMPEAGGVEDGVDEESGATRIVYTVKKTENMEGAANPWYSEDVTYLVKDDVVIGVITRGAVPEDDGSIEGLDVSRELWSDVRLGASIPEDTFVLPYPVQAAE